jgi:DNA-binding transcriptional LysR family regulator
MFGPRFARHLASRYRKRGLDKTAARIVAYLVDRGVDGASVLEIGGGVGDIQLELLGQGASRTTTLELVDAYDTDATELAETAGMRGRMTRRQVDIAATPDEVEAHDIFVMHRVVCCYPDYARLLTAAADHAKRLLVFSHPPRNWLTRTFTRLQNIGFRLIGKSFQIFAHPPAAMVAVAEGRGMRIDYTHRVRSGRSSASRERARYDQRRGHRPAAQSVGTVRATLRPRHGLLRCLAAW